MVKKADIVERAVKAAGSNKALAIQLGISPQALSQWKRKGVPPLRVLKFERATGFSRHEIRPDIYPPSLRRAASTGRASA